MVKVFIGWDSREPIAADVCAYSIQKHASSPVKIKYIKRKKMQRLGLYTQHDKEASTEFTLTRFLTPYLSKYEGYAVFCDCDFLFLNDIHKLMSLIDPNKAVSVVKHDYLPKSYMKFEGNVQHRYPRKNWSSLMVFNCEHESVKALTPKKVNSLSPKALHRFEWVNDSDIGSIPLEWNWLVGEYGKKEVSALHYTCGGPWHEGYVSSDFATEWCAVRDEMMEDSEKQ